MLFRERITRSEGFADENLLGGGCTAWRGGACRLGRRYGRIKLSRSIPPHNV
jgi:hypothetical protein